MPQIQLAPLTLHLVRVSAVDTPRLRDVANHEALREGGADGGARELSHQLAHRQPVVLTNLVQRRRGSSRFPGANFLRNPSFDARARLKAA